MIDIKDIGPLVFGAGSFNTIYGSESDLGDVTATLRRAFELGFKAVDTSAYYMNSESILGEALKAFPRESYFLTTKAGRWETNEFDYSQEGINRSVERSLKRLHTDYLDLLLIHDVEFQSETQALTAIKAAFSLREKGVVRYVGFSGYPLPYIVHLCQLVTETLKKSVDAILSYCNLTLQNNLLLKYHSELRVPVVFNASPLSMSLLSSRPTLSFHPASDELKARAEEVAKLTSEYGIELADLAEQYSFREWDGPTVVGLRSVAEVEHAVANYRKAKSSNPIKLEQECIDLFGNLHNQTWPSGYY